MKRNVASLSIWEKESFFAAKDVVIIGSGLAGLWSAYHLKKKRPSLSITILESGLIPTGASTRNAGFACFGSLTELMQDYHTLGETKMMELVSLRYRGLEQLQKVFRPEEIDFCICGGYELITDQLQYPAETLREGIQLINRCLADIIPFEETFRFANHKIKNFGFSKVDHLVENMQEGYLHSGKLCELLLRRLHIAGVTILNGVHVNGYTKAGGSFIVETAQGIELKAGALLVCTNAFAATLIPGLDIVPARGQILLTSEIPGLPFKGTFHADEGYYYFRNLGNRVLLGGARNKDFMGERSADMKTTGLIQEALGHYLSTHILPGRSFTITDRWSGIMAMGADKIPIVKQVEPGVFCAARMSGMGVALTPAVGEQIASMMLGNVEASQNVIVK
jgi:gamma-glutamylputrescine oxidase